MSTPTLTVDVSYNAIYVVTVLDDSHKKTLDSSSDG